MKLQAYLFLGIILLFNTGFAAKVHVHPQKNTQHNNLNAAKNAIGLEGCEIEVINHGVQPVEVFGLFDDGVRIKFNIFPNDLPHYISLNYNGDCHHDMFLIITTFDGVLVYSGFPSVGSSLKVFKG